VEAPLRPGGSILPGVIAHERLGGGLRTESWLAWSEALWSHVVVKLPASAHRSDPRAAALLAREARTLRLLRHPASPRLLVDGHREEPPHLVLERVEGPTLAEVLREEGPMAAGDVVRLGLQLGSCLHFAHGLGFVHLALRPGSVRLRGGRAVVLDWSDALAPGRRCPRGATPAGRPYLAPEQRPGATIAPAMDLFALGTVLYELATGRPAFDPSGAPRWGALPQLLEAPVRARVAEPSLPLDVDIVIHALLERSPRSRPGTAMEAIRLLAAALPAGEAPAWPSFVDDLLRA
jgi:eukaryotic-like serine/threonine-protein kinase